MENNTLQAYDFKRPPKFAKDQIRTLEMMHETFARLCTTALSGTLRTMVQMNVASIEMRTYEEYILSCEAPTLLGIILMDPMKGCSTLQIDSNITFAMIDRMAGGKGEALAANREVTDIELTLMEGILVRIIKNLRESWLNVIDLKARLGNIETNPQFSLIVPPKSMAVEINFNIQIGDVKGIIRLCLPYITIEPISKRLLATYWYESIKARDTSPVSIASVKSESEFCLEGESLSVKNLFNIRKGTLIRLPGFEKGQAFLRSGGSVISRFTQDKKDVGKNYRFKMEEMDDLMRDYQKLSGTGTSRDKEMERLEEPIRKLGEEMNKNMAELNTKIQKMKDDQTVLSEKINFKTEGSADNGNNMQAENRQPGTHPYPEARPFESINHFDVKNTSHFLAYEHPQITALVLTYLNKTIAADILTRMHKFAPAFTTGVIEKIACMGRTSPEIIHAIEMVLNRKLTTLQCEEYSAAGGITDAADILNQVGRSVEKGIMDSLRKNNPQVADSIKQKMFLFEDIIVLNESSLKKVLKAVELNTLVVALKSASDAVKEYLLKNLELKDAESVKTGIMNIGAVRLLEVESAQQKILKVIQEMEEAGEIVVFRADEKIVE